MFHDGGRSGMNAKANGGGRVAAVTSGGEALQYGLMTKGATSTSASALSSAAHAAPVELWYDDAGVSGGEDGARVAHIHDCADGRILAGFNKLNVALTEVKAVVTKDEDGDEVEEGLIEGYLSTFGNTDLHRDVIERGAFEETLKRKSISEIRLLWQHSPWHPMGVFQELREDKKGLYFKAQLVLETQIGREAYALLKARAVDRMSIGFMVRADDIEYDDKKRVRKIKKVDLWEGSVVTFPANPKAKIRRVKSAAEFVEELEQKELDMKQVGAAVIEAVLDEYGVYAEREFVSELVQSVVKTLEENSEHLQSGDDNASSSAAQSFERPRDVEKFLRDAGFPRDEAVAMAAKWGSVREVPSDGDGSPDGSQSKSGDGRDEHEDEARNKGADDEQDENVSEEELKDLTEQMGRLREVFAVKSK